MRRPVGLIASQCHDDVCPSGNYWEIDKSTGTERHFFFTFSGLISLRAIGSSTDDGTRSTITASSPAKLLSTEFSI
jgi:hypothetical protein